MGFLDTRSPRPDSVTPLVPTCNQLIGEGLVSLQALAEGRPTSAPHRPGRHLAIFLTDH